MKQRCLIVLVVAAMTLTGCNSNSVSYTLTDREKSICDSLKVDASIIQEVRAYNSSEIEPFHYSLSKIVENGVEAEADPIHLNGLVFTEQNSKSYELVFSLKDSFKQKGYSIFLLENNFNIDSKPDYIGVLKTTDKYAIIRQIGTDGINYDITNDSLINIVKQFDKKYSLDLIGVSGDWCEFAVVNTPADWLEFAKEVYAVCPDVVEQGTGSVEVLAEEMKRTKRLYFWWD